MVKATATTMQTRTRIMLNRTTVSETAPLQVISQTALLTMIAPTILPATGVATSRCSLDAQLATSSLANIARNATAKHHLNGNVPLLSPRLWPGSCHDTGDAHRKTQCATSKTPTQRSYYPTLLRRGLLQRPPRRVPHRGGNDSKKTCISRQLWTAPASRERPRDDMPQRHALRLPASRTSRCPS